MSFWEQLILCKSLFFSAVLIFKPSFRYLEIVCCCSWVNGKRHGMTICAKYWFKLCMHICFQRWSFSSFSCMTTCIIDATSCHEKLNSDRYVCLGKWTIYILYRDVYFCLAVVNTNFVSGKNRNCNTTKCFWYYI